MKTIQRNAIGYAMSNRTPLVAVGQGMTAREPGWVTEIRETQAQRQASRVFMRGIAAANRKARIRARFERAAYLTVVAIAGLGFGGVVIWAVWEVCGYVK